MGLFNKLKDIFYDDVEEENIDKPVKENKIEVKEVKIPEVKEEPKQEIVKEQPKEENTFTERELYRSERSFNYIDFDDEEEEPRKTALDLEKRVSRIDTPVTTAEPKVFKPSPVISPIYGILDKDYKKELQNETKTTTVKPSTATTVTYDSVRRKAYGTLEDELEDTLTKSEPVITVKEVSTSVDDIEKEVDKLEDKTAKIEDLISKIENSSNITVGEVEDKIKDEMFEDTAELPIEKDIDDEHTMTDNTLEHDLFNLIDSMYEDKED